VLQCIIKHPISGVALILISLVYLLVHFFTKNSEPSILVFLLYLLIFFLGIGLTRRTLLFYFPDITVAVSILVLALGTNVFCIVSLDYQLQPILLFAIYAMVVFFTAAWHRNQKIIYAIPLGFSIGLIILFQPTGYLSLLIPVLWGVHDKVSWKVKVGLIKNKLLQIFLFCSGLLILLIPDVYIWKASPGEILIFPFKLPGVFISFSSFLWEDLFSFDHGWLIYTPLMISVFIGFYFFSEKYRSIFFSIFVFCIIDLFLETSWSELGTTPVFGQVAFIPAYALLIFPLASFMELIRRTNIVMRIILSIITIILLLFNVFQTWQYNEGIILNSGMNVENYGLVFGRTNLTKVEKQQLAGLEQDTSFVLNDESRFRRMTLAIYDFEDTNVLFKSHLETRFVRNGKRAFTLNTTDQFSLGYKISYAEFTQKQWVGLRVRASVFAQNAVSFCDVNFVITSMHDKTNYQYKKLNLGDLKLKPGIWNTVSLNYMIPTDPYPYDNLVAYIWCTGRGQVYIDDLNYEAFEPKK